MTTEHKSDQQLAREWAQQLLARNDWVILDTETTGLGYDAECCQIAVIDPTGQALLDTLVKPSIPIPPDAERIHKISDAMVADAPTFAHVWPELRALLTGHEVIIYNADYDLRVLNRSGGAAGVPLRDLHPDLPTPERPTWIGGAKAVTCAMLQYAAYCGDWSEYHGDYRYQKLPHGDHSALGDARATLRVIKAMAGVPTVPIAVGLLDEEYSTYTACYGRFQAADVLAAFVADLMGSGRAGSFERQRLAHDWFTQWRRDQGERSPFERRGANEAER